MSRTTSVSQPRGPCQGGTANTGGARPGGGTRRRHAGGGGPESATADPAPRETAGAALYVPAGALCIAVVLRTRLRG